MYKMIAYCIVIILANSALCSINNAGDNTKEYQLKKSQTQSSDSIITNNLNPDPHFSANFLTAASSEDEMQIKSFLSRYHIGYKGDGTIKNLYYINPKNRDYVNGTSVFKPFSPNIIKHGYHSKTGAFCLFTMDNLAGSALTGMLIGWVATLFTKDDAKTFKNWSIGFGIFAFAIKQPNYSSFRPKKSMKLYSDWIPFDEIKSEARNLAETESNNSIYSYNSFLNKYPNGCSANYVKDKIAYSNLEKKKFESARIDNSINAYEKYLEEYPNGQYKSDALSKIEQLRYMDTEQINTIESYENYIQQYPQSPYITEAEEKINQIRYTRVEKENTIAAYTDFIANTSSREYKLKAMKKINEIYRLEYNKIDENNLAELKNFLFRFPHAGNADQVKYKISELEFAKVNKNNINELKKFSSRYPANKEARQLIKKIILDKLLKQNFKGQFVIKDIQPEPLGPEVTTGEQTITGNAGAGSLLINVGAEGSKLEFTGENLWNGNGRMTQKRITGPLSIWHFSGVTEYNGYTFKPKSAIIPLSFIFVQDLGFVHVYGDGEVTLKNGQKVILSEK